jgi:phosphoribosylglycinamide formyltransferase-1
MEEKEHGSLDVDVAFVFCNWDNLEDPNPRREQREMFFDMVRGYGIPLITSSWKGFHPDLWKSDQAAWRDEYGKLLRDLTRGYEFDLGVLAGYMLWMDDATCDEYDMINLHPALPDGPKGTWEEVIWELIRTDAKEHGVMLHICTRDWDRGGALAYCRFPIRGGEFDALWSDMKEKLSSSTLEGIKEKEGADEPLFREIRREGVRRELPLTVSTIRLFAEGTIHIEGKSLTVNGRTLERPYDMTDKVDDTLRCGI